MRADKRCEDRKPGCCPAHEWPHPDGCRWCGADWREHGTRIAAPPVGAHCWTEPTPTQRADRTHHHR